ncbi:PAP_central domain-containing protein, partial [Meloidogyne graminicola]
MNLPIFNELPFNFEQKMNAENALKLIIKENSLLNNYVQISINYVFSIISDWIINDNKCKNIEVLLTGSK